MNEDETLHDSDSPEFRRIQETLNRLATHLENVEAGVKAVNEKVDKHQAELVEVNRNLAKMNQRVDLFLDDLVEVRIINKEHDRRLAQLESDEGGLTTVN